MRSPLGFLLVAVLVTLAPGPATAMVLRVAARDGRAAALTATLGNAVGVLAWAVLSAIGVAALIAASEIAFDVLRFGGAAILILLGLRSILRPGGVEEPAAARLRSGRRGWRIGLVTSLSNPKLAAFFVALFPQFLSRGSPVLPLALAMAAAIVSFDLIWYSLLAFAIDRAGRLLRPGVKRLMEKVTGAVMVGAAVTLVAESR